MTDKECYTVNNQKAHLFGDINGFFGYLAV